VPKEKDEETAEELAKVMVGKTRFASHDQGGHQTSTLMPAALKPPTHGRPEPGHADLLFETDFE